MSLSDVAPKPRIRVAAGRKVAAAAIPEVETNYAAASLGARDMASWSTFRPSPDAALLGEQDAIAARSGDLRRNNGIANGAVRTLVDNIIGPRLACKPAPDRIALGKDSTWSHEWSREVESLFASFAESVWFDAGQRLNFHQAARLAFGSVIMNGEALALPLWLPDRGSKWKTAIQMIHPARLDTPNNLAFKKNIRKGVELDEFGAPIAYHIRKAHPIDFGTMFGIAVNTAEQFERVESHTYFDRIRVLHAYEQLDVGQTRGEPAFASVARQFKMLDHYMREELRLAVLNSLVFGALETPLDQASIVDLFDSSDKPFEAYQNAIKQWRVTMQGGAIIPMPPGTTIKPFLPQRSTAGLEQFAGTMLKYIGSGVNLPYELIFRDFSKTNYSSARAALLEAWRYFMAARAFMFASWCGPIYELWFEEAVGKGVIPDCTQADFYANRIAWTKCGWIAAGRGWIDPLREARAAEFRLRSGVTTLADECAEQGHDWREQMEQQAAENAEAKELGLPLPHTQAAGTKPANPVIGDASALEDAIMLGDTSGGDAAGGSSGGANDGSGQQ